MTGDRTDLGMDHWSGPLAAVLPDGVVFLVKKAPKSGEKVKVGSMIPNVLHVLTAAVKEKRCVAIRYHDQTHIRVIEPHAIYTAENGEIVVDGYQIRGYSSSGRQPPFWRPYRLKKISAVSLLKESFETRTGDGFASAKEKYRDKVLAMVDDRRQSFVFPSSVAPEEMGPHLPGNPHRR